MPVHDGGPALLLAPGAVSIFIVARVMRPTDQGVFAAHLLLQQRPVLVTVYAGRRSAPTHGRRKRPAKSCLMDSRNNE